MFGSALRNDKDHRVPGLQLIGQRKRRPRSGSNLADRLPRASISSASPRASSSSRVRACTANARVMFGSSVRRSSTSTRTPRMASSHASIKPVGPAPITATSVLRISNPFVCGTPSVALSAWRRIGKVTSLVTGCRPTISAVLHGRERECAQVDQLIAAAHERRSQALVVRGEAGIGKSALLDYAAEQARGLQILRTVGIQTESQLPFAAVHNLLAAGPGSQ